MLFALFTLFKLFYFIFHIEELPGVLIPDHVKCYTDQVPRGEQANSISSLIIGGTVEFGDMETHKLASNSWGTIIQEMVRMKEAIKKGRSNGQEDFKFMLYGNADSGPLSLLLNINPMGYKGHVSYIYIVYNSIVLTVYILCI